ncbi:MAG: hypothetical protein ACOH13_09360 [Flavobacteriales bacterium]
MGSPRTATNQVPPYCHGSGCQGLLVAFLLLASSTIQAQDLSDIKGQKPVQFSGSATLQGGPYLYSGDGDPRNLPWFWNANGNVNVALYGWQLPFSFSLGSQQRTFTQPFNRYGVSPYYKWIKLHAGYRSMRFNPYTLSGLQFFGGGLELEPKGFRFGAFYGRFSKPVAQDTLASISPVPAYERTGYGFKIGVGSPRTYVDFSMVHVQDDPNSIPDAVGNARFTPMENIAAGISARVRLLKKLTWQFDAGASALTEDTQLPVALDLEVPKFTTGFFTSRLGTKALFAGNTGLAWSGKNLGMKVNARQVDPGYRSLAAVYQQTDVRAITLEPTVRIKKNVWRLSGSIGWQEDNVRKQKAVASVRTIGSASVSWNPTRMYGLDASYGNYGIQQQAGLQVLNDTFRVAVANRSINLSQRFIRANNIRVWTATLTTGLQQLQDLNPFGSFTSSENQVLYGNLFVGRTRNRDNFSVNGGLNYSSNSTSIGTSVLIGPTVGTSLQFAKAKAMSSVNMTWNKALQDGKAAGTTLNFNGNIQYKLSTAHRLQLTVTALRNETSFVTSRRFTEIRFQGGYVFLLQPKPAKK